MLGRGNFACGLVVNGGDLQPLHADNSEASYKKINDKDI